MTHHTTKSSAMTDEEIVSELRNIQDRKAAGGMRKTNLILELTGRRTKI